MWTVLAPLLLFVIVILFQLGRTKETFVTTDASGNILDASGSPVGSTSLIQLTFSDLLKLFKAATPTPPAPTKTTSTIKEAIQEVVATNPRRETDVTVKPSVLQEIKSQIQGAPFEPAVPTPVMCDMVSDSIAQGVELTNAKADFANNPEYIRKDSIPCYGCTL